VKGLKQYWRELIVLLLCLPESSFLQIIEELFKVTLTANSLFALVFRFSVSRQGADIILPNGAVSVAVFCTGISNALLLLKLSAFYPVIFHQLA